MPNDITTFVAPSAVEKLFNRLFGFFVGIGLGLSYNYLLQVRGRTTGRVYSTPVNVLNLEGKRYIVAPRGNTQWVRNASASGRVTLKKGFRSEEFGLRAIADSEKARILKAYLDNFKTAVQRYFSVPAGSDIAAFQPLASRYPVFELLPK